MRKVKIKPTKEEKELLAFDVFRFRFDSTITPFNDKEDILQLYAAGVLDFNKELWFHPANEAKRSYALAQYLSDRGLKSGIPDCMIISGNIAIELKTKKNKPTANQIRWLKDLSKQGWRCCWVASHKEFDLAYKHFRK